MVFFKLFILILFGVITSNLIGRIGLPRVSAYFFVGILMGPSFFGVFTYEELDAMSIINHIALACVGFGVGNSFNYREIKYHGAKIIVLTIFESLMTALIVFGILFFIAGQSFEVSILLGAISSATAPAVPLMVLKQFKAKGDLTKTIIPIVGMDDVVCVLVFGISLAVAQIIVGDSSLSVSYAALNVVFNIFTTVALGVIFGLIFSFIIKSLKKEEDVLVLTIGIAFLGVGMAVLLELELIILCMTLGAMVSNFVPEQEKVFENLSSNFMPPVFIVFFGISAASLQINYLFDIGMVGIIYIVARAVGKVVGSAVGAQISGFPSVVKKYLGISILSQAGVGIGLAVIVKQELGDIGNYIYTIALGGVLIYEIIGPLLTKYAIKKAGEINQ